MKALNIRDFTPSDFERVVEINTKAFTPIHQAFKERFGEEIYQVKWHDWIHHNTEYIRSIFDKKEAIRLKIAEYHGKIVGFVAYRMDLETKVGTIDLNAVDPDYQGRGIGKAMYRAVIRVMKAKQMRVVEVSTGGDEAHAPARRAYEACGFVKSPNVYYCQLIDRLEC